MFTPKIGEDSQFDEYFSKGLVQPPTSILSSSPQKKSVASWIQVLNTSCWLKFPQPPRKRFGGVPDGRWDGIGSRLMRPSALRSCYIYSIIWVVVSNIFYFHPYLAKIPILPNIFQMGWNHQLDHSFLFSYVFTFWPIFMLIIEPW